jgi:hypothetical protein
MGLDELDLKVSIRAAIDQPGKMSADLDKLDPRLDLCFGGLALNKQVIREGESGSAALL